MRRALFGGAQASAPVEMHLQTVSDGIPNVAIVVPVQEYRQRLSADLFTRLVRHIAQLPTLVTS
ncbi:hypothetical protein EMIT0P258_50044 [Pseudomonas sp. IT-P258]